MLDFGVLPPEINSGRMYSGPGSGSMLTAATAWDGLAAELRSAAESYGSVVTGLTSNSWLGPASVSMVAAVTPYVAWMNSTAAQAEDAASQAKAAVTAYETAFAATVPPPVITANRTQLAALAATNFFGQNSPAIAATEAQYSEMWAQDTAAMYSYAGQSATATTVTPFAAPPQTANPQAGLAAQPALTAGTLASTSAQTAASTASTSSTSATALPGGITTLLSPNSGPLQLNSSNYYDILHTWLQEYNSYGAGYHADSIGPNIISGPSGGTSAPAAATSAPAGGTSALGGGTPGGAWSSPSQLAGLGGGEGAPTSARIGQAGTIGRLSVPPSWAGAPSGLESASQGLVSTRAAAHIHPGPNGVLRGVPAMGANLGRHSGGGFIHRYGFRHAVMQRPPSAG